TVKIAVCPSDPTVVNGVGASPNIGWAVTSYPPVYWLFGANAYLNSATRIYVTRSQYNLRNIPDRTADQIALVERYGSFPSYSYENCLLYPGDRYYYGYNTYCSIYGAWGFGQPQLEVTPNLANPFYPNSSHTTCQVALMDGSIRGIAGG